MTDLQTRVDSVPIWHHIIDLPGGIRTPGRYDPSGTWNRLRLPDLRDKRVLDVGTRDGWFAFECERAGAEVLAVDVQSPDETGFSVTHGALGSKVQFKRASVYELVPDVIGRFDVVLFLGVLYHLRHPLLALDRLRALCTGMIAVETLVMDNAVFTGGGASVPMAEIAPGLKDIPMVQYLEGSRFYPADPTNYFSPNVTGLRAMVVDAGFAEFSVQSWGSRAMVQAVCAEVPRLVRMEHV